MRDIGRPRRFDSDTEREMLLRAARRLLRTRRYGEMTVAAVLEESNLHTRAFYRHFRSKEELFLTLYQENAAELCSILERRVDEAASPAAAVEAWIDELLRLHFDRRSSDHVSIYREAANAADQPTLVKASVDQLLAPLRRALSDGRDDGTLPNAVPDAHAAMIWSLVWNDLAWADRGRREQRWTTARERLVSFVMTGLAGPTPAGARSDQLAP